MTAFALLFTLSAIGVSETAYLIRKRIALQKPICLLGENCAVVLESKYNRIFVIPNDVLGLIFYVASSSVAALIVIAVPPTTLWDIIFKIMIVIGALLSALLTYLQWRVIKSWCFWCLMSAFTIWIMGFILLISNYI